MATTFKLLGQATTALTAGGESTPYTVPGGTKAQISLIAVTVGGAVTTFGVFHVKSGAALSVIVNMIRSISATTGGAGIVTVECGTGIIMETGDKIMLKNTGGAGTDGAGIAGAITVCGVEIA